MCTTFVVAAISFSPYFFCVFGRASEARFLRGKKRWRQPTTDGQSTKVDTHEKKKNSGDEYNRFSLYFRLIVFLCCECVCVCAREEQKRERETVPCECMCICLCECARESDWMWVRVYGTQPSIGAYVNRLRMYLCAFSSCNIFIFLVCVFFLNCAGFNQNQ